MQKIQNDNIGTEVINNITDTVIENDKYTHKIEFVESSFLKFYNLVTVPKTFINNDRLQSFEITRYVKILHKLTTLCSQVINLHTVNFELKKCLESYFYHIYKKSDYYKCFRRIYLQFIIKDIIIHQCKYRTVKTVALISQIFEVLKKQLLFIPNLLQISVLQHITKDSLNDFICKILFICTIMLKLVFNS